MKKEIFGFDFFTSRRHNESSLHDPLSNAYQNSIQLEFEMATKSPINFALNDFLAFTDSVHSKIDRHNAPQNPSDHDELSVAVAEKNLSLIFDSKVILYPNHNQLYNDIFKKFITPNDVLFIDKELNTKCQITLKQFLSKKQKYESIRHNDIGLLENKLKSLHKSKNKIIYFADSIYLFQGDIIPLVEIRNLLNTYENFFLIIDDTRGLSWMGENGRGMIKSFFNNHPKVVLTASLNKGFCSYGSILACNKDIFSLEEKSIFINDTFTESYIGDIIESSEKHLKNDVWYRQSKLQENINYFYTLCNEMKLPVSGQSNMPVAFFNFKSPQISQEIWFNLINRGYYLTILSFPLVSPENTGIAANITLHRTRDDIKDLLLSIYEEYNIAQRKRKLY